MLYFGQYETNLRQIVYKNRKIFTFCKRVDILKIVASFFLDVRQWQKWSFNNSRCLLLYSCHAAFETKIYNRLNKRTILLFGQYETNFRLIVYKNRKIFTFRKRVDTLKIVTGFFLDTSQWQKLSFNNSRCLLLYSCHAAFETKIYNRLNKRMIFSFGQYETNSRLIADKNRNCLFCQKLRTLKIVTKFFAWVQGSV